jgi:hypothetical protein
MPPKRKAIPAATMREVLIEAGYRCGVPTCRTILAIDLHHMEEVSEGGGNSASNLLALCPTCHGLHHRGTIPKEAIFAWKSVIVTLGFAFDREAVDHLLFLSMCHADFMIVSGDGLLHYSRLIAAGLAKADKHVNSSMHTVTYAVNISEKGRHLIEAWKKGDRSLLKEVLIPSEEVKYS